MRSEEPLQGRKDTGNDNNQLLKGSAVVICIGHSEFNSGYIRDAKLSSSMHKASLFTATSGNQLIFEKYRLSEMSLIYKKNFFFETLS